jgi:uncharacterized protein
MSESAFQRVLGAPVLGVGLGIDIFDTSPDFRVLIAEHREGFDFLEVYSRGDWRHTDAPFAEIPDSVPRTYHHEGLDPVGPGLCPDGPIDGCAKNQRLLNPPWTVEELAVRHIDGRYTDFFFPCILNRECIKATIDNLNALHARVPGPLLPENPPCEFVVGDVHLFDFMNEVAHGADCGLVLDLGHVWSYQLCKGRGDQPDHAIEKLDLSRVIEVHLAGARVDAYPGGRIYRDLHGAGAIPEESLFLLRELMPKLPNLKAITIEVENATEEAAVEQAAQVRAEAAKIMPGYKPAPVQRPEGAFTPAGDVKPAPVDAALERQYRRVYELVYKNEVRDEFMRGDKSAAQGLTGPHAAQIDTLDRERIKAVAEMQADDIGTNWCLRRFPATWTALMVALDCTHVELAKHFTGSDAFETRLHDDTDSRAFAAFVHSLGDVDDAPWLEDLLRYERLLAGHWTAGTNPRVEEFGWDVAGIHHALLEEELFPTDEEPARRAVLLYKGTAGVNEAPLTRQQAEVLQAILNGKEPKGRAKTISECERLLKEIQQETG